MRCLFFVSRQPPLQEIVALQRALELRGHVVDYFDLQAVPATDLVSNVRNQILNYDLIYHRAGLGSAIPVLLQEMIDEDRQIFINPAWFRHPMCTNKFYQGVRVSQAGVSIPKTYFCNYSSFADLANKLGLPFIAKAAYGIQGKQVYKVTTEDDFLHFQKSVTGDQVAQELIPNDGDFRVFMIGGVLHDIYKRVLPEGAYRSNMSQGATGEVVLDKLLRSALETLGTTIASTMSLDVTGIDIIQHSETKHLYFLEANINPGWKGLDSTLGTDTANAVANYFEERYKCVSHGA